MMSAVTAVFMMAAGYMVGKACEYYFAAPAWNARGDLTTIVGSEVDDLPPGLLKLLANTNLTVGQVNTWSQVEAFWQSKRFEWMGYIMSLPEPDLSRWDKWIERGIFMFGGKNNNFHVSSVDYTLDALMLIASLRRTGCKLPIELWHNHDTRLLGDDGAAIEAALKSLGGGAITLHDLHTLPHGDKVKGYAMIPYALQYCRFQQVLLLDADNLAVEDPTELFDSKEFQETGTIFWPDHETYNIKSPMWRIVGKEPYPVMTLDNAQMMVDKKQHWKALALASFFNTNYHFYYLFSLGDCELFTMAWVALDEKFHMAQNGINHVGYVTDDEVYCSDTILQVHPAKPDKAMFAHRTMRKWSTSLGRAADPRWNAIKRGFIPTGEGVNWKPLSHPRTVGNPNVTAMAVGDSRCKCSRYETSEGCFNLNAPVDNSTWAKDTLLKLKDIDQDLHKLLWAMVNEDLTSGEVLKPKWWEAWVSYLRSQAGSKGS
eukprot:gnl/TRDRNA2_/TRDRNA2_81286_c0_seq1.p1 gnl/TRDRNA2_/TRDRNA2_81286_c0~~gnl/TRDRNA2_/TRDRNA2_81286_c0_seq1.p1  ORF type:complete len:486 (-),score=86.69 gnl/TRDRNA2_/TRDRNA2_81286_c0_seq1:94-1551(-)